MRKILLQTGLVAALAALTAQFAAAETRTDAIDISRSDCLRNTRSEASDEEYEYEEYEDTFSWSLEYKDGILSVTWLGFEANCCPEGFNSWIDKDGSNLTYTLKEAGYGLCNCICNFDITTLFGEIEPGRYTLTFRSWNDIFTTEIDIREGLESFVTYSPSGVRQLNASESMGLSAEGVIHVEAGCTFTLEIFDSAGRMLSRVESEGTQDININALPKGVYTARLSADGAESTLRFIR